MNTFSVTQNISEIVAVLPEAGRILRQYGIDFCCGGNRPLSKAINEQSLNGEEILNRLGAAFDEAQADCFVKSVNKASGNVARRHLWRRESILKNQSMISAGNTLR